jgi:hypothetical protein
MNLGDDEFGEFMDDYWDTLEDFMEEDIGEEEDVCPSLKRKRKGSKHITDEQLSQSIWGLMLAHPDVKDPESKIGKKFRLRFRVPYPLFKAILVPICIEENIFECKRQSQIQLEIKLLVCLRILGRGHDFDTLNEISFFNLLATLFFISS